MRHSTIGDSVLCHAYEFSGLQRSKLLCIGLGHFSWKKVYERSSYPDGHYIFLLLAKPLFELNGAFLCSILTSLINPHDPPTKKTKKKKKKVIQWPPLLELGLTFTWNGAIFVGLIVRIGPVGACWSTWHLFCRPK